MLLKTWAAKKRELQSLINAIDFRDESNPEMIKRRKALAAKIQEVVSDELAAEDLTSFLVDIRRDVAYNEQVFIKTRHTARVALIKPGEYSPRIQIVEDLVQVATDLITCHPSMFLYKLQTGAFGTVQEMVQAVKDEMLGKKSSLLWTALNGAISSSDTNYGTFASSDTPGTKKIALDTAIDYVADNASEVKAVVGRRSALSFIADLDGYNSTAGQLVTQLDNEGRREIRMTGILGTYRGAPIIALKNFVDYNSNSWIDASNIHVVGSGTVAMAQDLPLQQHDSIDIDHMVWHMRFDESYGFLLRETSRNYRLAIT